METQIFDYGMNGEGVAKVNDIITLVPLALKNETVEINITKSYGNYNTAELITIKQPSLARQAPPCPYFSVCGGCDIQHMNYSEQLDFKTLLIKKTLKKIANIDFDVSPTIPSDNVFEYRNKASFNYNNSSSGFYKQNSKDIAEINQCMLCSANINKVYNLFNLHIKTNNLKGIKHLVVREINNQILVGVVAKNEIDLSTFYTLLNTHFNTIGLFLIVNTRNDSVVISGKIKHVAGIKYIKIENFGLTYFVDLVGFHQTNINIQNKLYKKVLEYVSPTDIVVNGFSGQGLLTAIIASKAKKVIGIEIVKNSHLSAEKLKKDNNIKNMQNILGDFNKKISPYLTTANTLILDPSKKGCGKEVLSNIKNIQNIIYISCNPIAMAKDLNILQEHYDIEEITPFDMFPNTKSVETLIKLKLKTKNC